MDNRGMRNNVGKLINMEKAKRTMLTGRNVTLKEVTQDIADFCKVGYETIKSYKDRKSIPSLSIALKLSEYFRTSVNEIFIIEDYEKLIENTGNRGRKPRSNIEECNYGDCSNKILAKGLCQKHYHQARLGKIKI